MKDSGLIGNLSRSTARVIRLLFIAAVWVVPTSTALAKFAPDTDWETFRTRNFRIHHPPSYRTFAAELGVHLEEARLKLIGVLGWEPSGDIEVVVRGDTDEPNGIAAVFPMNRLIIHAVPFSRMSSIGEYDNWIRTLAYHELTHIIANDTTGGVFSAARAAFGTVAKVNSYQPRWLIEGLAVYQETMQGEVGRGRSAFVDMVLRVAARDGLLVPANAGLGLSLDRLNDGPPRWPGPVTPYLFGYVMTEILAREGGAEAPGKASLISGRTVPFLPDVVASRLTGRDYPELWDEAVKTLNRISAEDLARIRSRPVTVTRPITDSGRWSSGPAIDDAGDTLYYVRDSYSEGLGISSVDLRTGKRSDLTSWNLGGGSRLRHVRDPRTEGRGAVLYSRVARFRNYRLYSDVFLWDVESEREIQLTSGARAMDPDHSPEFRWEDDRVAAGALVYVKNLDDGNQAIVVRDSAGERVLHRGERFERLSYPCWGRGHAWEWIVFSLKTNEAGERLMAIHSRQGTLRALTRRQGREQGVDETTPYWSPDGTLYFASSVGGVFNIHRLPWHSLQRSLAQGGTADAAERITNLESGALFPLARGEELLAAVYGSGGFDIARVDARPLAGTPAAVDSPHAKLSGRAAKAVAPAQPPATPAEPSSYSVFPAILPKFWLPFAQRLADGWHLGASTFGHDALERHRYSLSAAWDTRGRFPVYRFSYRFDGLYPSIILSHERENQYLGLFRSSNPVSVSSLSLEYPIGDWEVAFGGTVSQSQFFGEEAANGGLRARFSHGRSRGFPDSIEPDLGESGHLWAVAFTGYFVGRQQFPAAEARLEQRIPLPFNRHFLRLVASGAHTTSDTISALWFAGGGEEAIASGTSYLVRGYVPGSLYGRSIATLNAEYWLPIADVFRGKGTLPVFYERAKARIYADVGSAEFVAGQRDRFSRWPVGAGVQVLQDFRALYHFPMTVAAGFNWGLTPGLGDEKQLVFGLFARTL